MLLQFEAEPRPMENATLLWRFLQFPAEVKFHQLQNLLCSSKEDKQMTQTAVNDPIGRNEYASVHCIGTQISHDVASLP